MVVTINSMIISLDRLTGGGVELVRGGINRKDPGIFPVFMLSKTVHFYFQNQHTVKTDSSIFADFDC